jgi:hypothetical protein
VKKFTLLFLFFVATVISAQSFPDSVFILNGCGGNSVINKTVSESGLVKFFGPDNVKREARDYAEGTEVYNCTILFPGSRNELVIKWKDDSLYKFPEFIEFSGKHSSWKLSDGIAPGTLLKDILKLNGKNFTFSGFGWDYGGIVNFNGGKLDNKCFIVQLALDENEKVSSKTAGKILGETEVSASAGYVAGLKIYVDRITINFN